MDGSGWEYLEQERDAARRASNRRHVAKQEAIKLLDLFEQTFLSCIKGERNKISFLHHLKEIKTKITDI